MLLPKVSFVSPIFNEGRQIGVFLENIRGQDYPQDRIEVVIADGGSTDDTVQIASRFDCRVINNPERLAEAGLVRCEEEATGDLMVAIAADNRLPRRDWLTLMVRPFLEDEKIGGAYTHIEPATNDNSINRYYSLLHVEPFTWLIYQDAANPRRFRYCYQQKEVHEGYIVYGFSVADHPLIAFAQGFVYRRQFRRKAQNRGDDVLPFIQLLEEGHKIAYVPEAGMVHLHLDGYGDYLRKYRGRIRNNLYHRDTGVVSRMRYLSPRRRLRSNLWLLYGCTLLGPIFHSVRWWVRDKESCWLWHIPASVGLAYLIVYEVARKKFLEIMAYLKLIVRPSQTPP